jgi:hypothetical protein
LKGKKLCKDVGVDGKIILTYMFRKWSCLYLYHVAQPKYQQRVLYEDWHGATTRAVHV